MKKSSSEQNYSQVLSELEHRGSYEMSARPRDISKLSGIRNLLQDLGHPEQNFRIVHIAGTNGKGLTAAMLSHLLCAQGFATGCYTSPHLLDIRERIALNGRWVSQKTFARSASAVLKIAHGYRGNPYLSYFDLLTAIAFDVFRKECVEWVVLETGLGGRADSTNVTDKELCILTRIGIDHQEVLGADLKEIAAEKLGIARSGIPMLLARQTPELASWLHQQLSQKNTPVFSAEKIFETQFLQNGIVVESPLSVPWRDCLHTSLSAMQVLFEGDDRQRQTWLEAAQTVRLPGRLDLRHGLLWHKHSAPDVPAFRFKTLLLDGGHNPDALEALSEYIVQYSFFPCTLILGMASDKLRTNTTQIKKLCAQAGSLILTPIASQRSTSPEMLENFLRESGGLEQTPEIRRVSSAEEALKVATTFPEMPLVVAGSFYLVGEILRLLENESEVSAAKNSVSKRIRP